MIVKLLTEQQLEFPSLKGGCRGSSESTLVKMPYCWKSHALALKLETSNSVINCVITFTRLWPSKCYNIFLFDEIINFNNI